jgi:HlyD family secretion protein
VKRKWKIVITLAVVLIFAAGIYASAQYSKRGVVTVQTGQVARMDLTSLVTASGEIKPKDYHNIGADAAGDLTEILVKEGDHVRKGQLLAKIEDVQPQADVEAQKAALSSAEANSTAAEAGLKSADENTKTMQAALEKDRADLARMKADFERSQELYNEKLLAKQDYEVKKFTYEAQVAAIRESEARVAQAKVQREQYAAQLASAQKQIAQSRAILTRANDILRKHNAYSPIDGVVTNLPVRLGESVVQGIQSSAGSNIMTIADMSLDRKSVV